MDEFNQTREQLFQEWNVYRLQNVKSDTLQTQQDFILNAFNEAEERYKILAEYTQDFIFIIDKKGIILYVNNFAAKYLKHTPEDIIGKEIYNVLPQNISWVEPRNIQMVFDFGKPSYFEEKIILQDKTIWLDTRLVPINSGKEINSVLVISKDVTEVKNVHNLLKESEQIFKDFIKDFPDNLILTDLDGNILSVSNQVPALFGFKESQEMIGIKIFDLLISDNRERFLSDIKNVLREGLIKGVQYLFYKKNEGRFIGELNISILREVDGRPKGFIITAVDITESKKIEELLIESERKYRKLWENAPISYHSLNKDGIITRVNLTEAKILGYTVDEMEGKSIFDFIVNEEREEALERFSRKICGEPVSGFEYRNYLRKDGTKISVVSDDIIERDSKGNIIGIHSTFIDITEQKKIEAMLKEQKEFSAKLLQNSTAPTFVLDNQHNVIIWNKACEELTGIKASDLIGTDNHWKAFYEFKRPCLADIIIDGSFKEMGRFYNIYGKSTILPEGLHAEGWFKSLGGRERYIVFDAAPIFDGNGKLIASIETLQDITDRKRAEEEINQSFKKLRLTLEETVNALASTAEKRDSYTAGHQHRVMKLACAIANEMGFNEEQIEGIRVAATLHDIGKIYVPAEILNKPGKLIDLEMGLIRIHPKVGYDILKTIPFSWPVAQIVLQHHERIDGSGYPLGLLGDDILLEAKILGVADVVEAIAHNRPYRTGMFNLGIDKALEEIMKNKGILYDVAVVDACINLFQNRGFKFD